MGRIGPGSAHRHPGPAHQHPGSTPDRPKATRIDPGLDPQPPRIGPNSTPIEPGSTQRHPGSTQMHPGSTPDRPTATLDRPCLVVGLSGSEICRCDSLWLLVPEAGFVDEAAFVVLSLMCSSFRSPSLASMSGAEAGASGELLSEGRGWTHAHWLCWRLLDPLPWLVLSVVGVSDTLDLCTQPPGEPSQAFPDSGTSPRSSL